MSSAHHKVPSLFYPPPPPLPPLPSPSQPTAPHHNQSTNPLRLIKTSLCPSPTSRLLDSTLVLIYQEIKATDMKYKNRVRSRISNLKDPKNPGLRKNVLAGTIALSRIASMSAEVRPHIFRTTPQTAGMPPRPPPVLR